MKCFLDNTKVKLEDLRTIGIYDLELLDELEKGHFNKLAELEEKYREDREFMEPILYAVLDKFRSYEVYRYYGDKLKDFLKTETYFSREIINNDPQLIVNSPISEDKELILDCLYSKPDIIKYISPKLDEDKEFLTDLSKRASGESLEEVIEKYSVEKIVAVNPELKSDERFMVRAISLDISAIKYADKNILNSYDVFREASVNNTEVITYVIDNEKDLGIDAICGVRDTAKENTFDAFMNVIEENIDKGNDARFEKVRSKIEERREDNPAKIKWAVAMAAQSEEINPGLINDAINYASLSRIRLEKRVEENADYEFSTDDALELITPHTLNCLIDKLPSREMSSDIQLKVGKYNKFYEGFSKSFRQQKQQRAKLLCAEKKIDDVEILRNAIRGNTSHEDYRKAEEEWNKRKQLKTNTLNHSTNFEK